MSQHPTSNRNIAWTAEVCTRAFATHCAFASVAQAHAVSLCMTGSMTDFAACHSLCIGWRRCHLSVVGGPTRSNLRVCCLLPDPKARVCWLLAVCSRQRCSASAQVPTRSGNFTLKPWHWVQYTQRLCLSTPKQLSMALTLRSNTINESRHGARRCPATAPSVTPAAAQCTPSLCKHVNR
jgi:hypothetical protein